MNTTLTVSQYTADVARGESPQPVGAVVCVMLHHPDRAPSPRLFRALARKSIDVRVCLDRYAALQTLCGCARDPGTDLGILLLAEPAEINGAGELVTLARAYAPSSVCWVYTAEPSEQVREVRDADLEAWSPVHLPHPAPRSGEADDGTDPDPPARRIVHESREGSEDAGIGPIHGADGTDDADDDNAANQGPILTDEELAMLLADEPEDPDRDDPNRDPNRDDDR